MSQIDERRQITVSEMAPHVHSFLPNENKVNKISEWLIDWIKKSLKNGQIKPNDFLPLKGELAFHIGVSLGTMQNVFRVVEDKGYIESRQRVGTYIKDSKEKNKEKLTSKREVAKELVKWFIKENDYNSGDVLLSVRKLSNILAVPFATMRASLDSLISDGILIKKEKSYLIRTVDFDIKTKESQTLVEKIANHISVYIKNNLKPGEKLPSNNALADMYGVSIKTIHDSIKLLVLSGIIKTKRGYYGTIVADKYNDNSELYFYEQVEQCLKKYIAENCQVGTKLPSIKNFAEIFNVSAKTIKNALDNLAYDGYINFERGRYGGTFVIELPTVYEKGYTWLSLSPEFEQMN